MKFRNIAVLSALFGATLVQAADEKAAYDFGHTLSSSVAGHRTWFRWTRSTRINTKTLLCSGPPHRLCVVWDGRQQLRRHVGHDWSSRSALVLARDGGFA